MAGCFSDEYNSLVEANPGLLAESVDYLVRRFSEVKLVFGGRTLSPYLRPHLVSSADWARIVSPCEAVWSAVEKVGRAASQDPGMMDELGVTEIERRLASIDPGYDDVSVTARFDSFLSGDEYRFVELNAECPAGIAYADAASAIFAELPVMKKFAERHSVRPLYCRRRLLDSMLEVYSRVRGRGDRPTIAIVDYKGQPTQREFELFKEYFEHEGYATTIADPRDLELRKGKLCHGGFAIDIVYRRVLVNEFVEKMDECRALLEAYRTGTVVVVNSFRTKYVHKKMLFGILTGEGFARLFTDSEREAIRLHIPWTRRVRDRATEYNGNPVGLLEFVRENRDRLVLKPNDDYGGHGVFIGWEMTQGEWDSALGQSLQGDYLVQERVSTEREVFPFVDEADGSVQMIEQLLDIDPLLFFGRVEGAFTRLSSSLLANVTSGGGMVPTMIVD